jgi:ubiquitin-protein ligase E3 A
MFTQVHFVGEEGVDEGGVQKEFFQLLIRQIFDPAYCMFSYDEDTRLFWFKPSPLDLDIEFELVR